VAKPEKRIFHLKYEIFREPKTDHHIISLYIYIHKGSRGSSVSVVSGYGLGDRAIEVGSSAEAKGFFLQPLCPDWL
jgi:hypothetical protein